MNIHIETDGFAGTITTDDGTELPVTQLNYSHDFEAGENSYATIRIPLASLKATVNADVIVLDDGKEYRLVPIGD